MAKARDLQISQGRFGALPCWRSTQNEEWQHLSLSKQCGRGMSQANKRQSRNARRGKEQHDRRSPRAARHFLGLLLTKKVDSVHQSCGQIFWSNSAAAQTLTSRARSLLARQDTFNSSQQDHDTRPYSQAPGFAVLCHLSTLLERCNFTKVHCGPAFGRAKDSFLRDPIRTERTSYRVYLIASLNEEHNRSWRGRVHLCSLVGTWKQLNNTLDLHLRPKHRRVTCHRGATCCENAAPGECGGCSRWSAGGRCHRS